MFGFIERLSFKMKNIQQQQPKKNGIKCNFVYVVSIHNKEENRMKQQKTSKPKNSLVIAWLSKIDVIKIKLMSEILLLI